MADLVLLNFFTGKIKVYSLGINFMNKVVVNDITGFKFRLFSLLVKRLFVAFIKILRKLLPL